MHELLQKVYEDGRSAGFDEGYDDAQNDCDCEEDDE